LAGLLEGLGFVLGLELGFVLGLALESLAKTTTPTSSVAPAWAQTARRTPTQRKEARILRGNIFASRRNQIPSSGKIGFLSE